MRFSRMRGAFRGAGLIFLATVFGANAWGQDAVRKGPQKGEIKRTKLQSDPRLAIQIQSPFRQPDELKPAGGVHKLTLGTARFVQAAASQVDPAIPGKFDMLCYNGQPVGPIIRVKRGSTLRIHLKNALQGPKDPGPDPADDGRLYESIHGLCTTNLHTHGLHVSPTGNGDNVFLALEPGTENLFTYNIDAKHPSGTFWYHPHKHGSVAYQLSNGVSGALIVEGDPNDDIADLEDIREIREAAERVLVLQWYVYGSYKDGTDTIGFIDARNTRVYNINPSGVMTCPEIAPKSPLDPSAEQADNLLAINGTINPQFEIRPGEVQRWRVVHAGWDQIQQFQWFEADGVTPATDINFHEIALDGLATGKMTELTALQIAPGQRSDVLIKAPEIPEGSTKTYFLKRLESTPLVGTGGGQMGEVLVATLVVRGTPKPMKLPSDMAALARCRPFKSIADSELVPPTLTGPDGKPTGTLTFRAADPDPTDPTTPYYTLNNKTYHNQVPVPLTLGTAQEWTLQAGASAHPFHIHVNPFQVISYTDPSGLIIPMDTWRDTLFIPEGASYTIRSRYTEIAGESVLHCHILDHEDQGMMMPILLIDPKNPKPPGKAAALTPTNRSAPDLQLADMAGKTHALADSRGHKVILVFFKGIQCAHCADDLRTMLKDARARAGDEAEIIAVSSKKIADPARASKLLGVVDGDRFRLLVDESHTTFRAYGCLTGDEPQHGLFLIDATGTIRSRYVGETPFGDSEEVFARLRQMAASR